MKKILIIDDDQEMANLIRVLLKYYRYDAMVAYDPRKGIAIARREKPDLILMDVLMPAMNGREACRILKKDEKTRHIPVIFLTAKNSMDDIIGEAQAGGTGHVAKPFDSKELLENIRKYCL